MTNLKMRGAATATALIAALALTACGGGSAPETANTDGGTAQTQELTLSTAPVLFAAPVQHAVDTGLFTEAGIEATMVFPASPAETMPQLMSGDLDLAIMDLQSAIQSRSEGFPLVVHAPVIQSAEVSDDPHGFGMLMVMEDGPVQTPADVAGHTVGVNSVGSQGWLDLVTALQREGVDTSTVEFVEVPSSRAAAALQQGQVDSIVLGEPFGTASMAEAPIKSILRVDTGIPGVPSFAWVSTEQFASENPELVATFNEVMLAANTAVQEDPSLAIAAAKNVLDVDPALLEQANYPVFVTEPLTLAQLEQVGARLEEHGIVEPGSLPDLSSMIWS